MDTFLSTYNHANGYSNGTIKLTCGNTVTIQDGTYNAQWMIAGFDVEHNQVAADGTIYDNGYGIALVPVTQLTTGKWNTSNIVTGGYKSSYMHNTTMPTVATNLQKVLGSHLVQRNVLLSSSVSSSKSNAYTWTTAYCTLMSIGQMNGTFASNSNKYDDGEADYKLPVFDKTEFKTGSYFWSRGVSDYSGAWYVNTNGDISGGQYDVSYSFGVRPLIYIR